MNSASDCDGACGICGELHRYSECSLIPTSKHVPDQVLQPKARATLPKIVNIETMADGSYTVVANTLIEKGTQFGPLDAQKLLTLDPNIIFPLKLFNNQVEDLSEYYLDTSDEYHCNWLMFIAPAQNLEEQNLICFQEKLQILYVCLKDIKSGEYLKVWYSPFYAKQMQKEVLTDQKHVVIETSTIISEPIDLNNLLKKQQKLTNRESWICKFCGKLEKDISLFTNHIIKHYSKRLTKTCDICSQSFSTLRHLRKHVKTVHGKPNVRSNIKVAPVEYMKSKDAVLGGPLLNDLLTDSLDNTNLVLPNMELNLNAMENDALSLAVDNLLTENVKELDHFNFDIDESHEQFVCDICLKVFTKLQYLIQHLKKHTGRFTCRYCLKIFCRKENLEGHNCQNAEISLKSQCSLCGKSFTLKRYLTRHMYIVHDRKYACEKCNKLNESLKDYKEHNCSAIPSNKKEVFPCSVCGKKFYHIRYLKKHVATHKQKREAPLPQSLICEVCGVQCKSHGGLYLHRRSHSEPSFECHLCNKKFYRKDVLDDHLLTHTNMMVTCNICNKSLKTQRTLENHMLQHTVSKQYKCDKCPRSFSQIANLNAHNFKIHLKRCKLCNQDFNTLQSLEMHKQVHKLSEFFVCPVCSKCVKLRSSLVRHLKQNHLEHDTVSIMNNVKPTQANLTSNPVEDDNDKNNASMILDQLDLNPFSNSPDLHHSLSENDSNFDSIVENFENMINSYNMNSTNDLPLNTYEVPKTNEKRMLDFTDLQMDIDSNFDMGEAIGMGNQEVCLSMPDLTGPDQEITLGNSAYILDNGTIVEPKDQGNVLVYVLDNNL